MIPIAKNTRVTLNFALRVSESEEIDSTYENEPATFEVGDGNLLENFENLLLGMVAGDHEVFRLSPEEGFGAYNEDNLQKKTLDEFDDMDELELSIGLVVEFNDPAMGQVPGVIVDYDSQYVTVDFNHPLAGRELVFEVDIIEVEALSVH